MMRRALCATGRLVCTNTAAEKQQSTSAEIQRVALRVRRMRFGIANGMPEQGWRMLLALRSRLHPALRTRTGAPWSRRRTGQRGDVPAASLRCLRDQPFGDSALR